MISLKAIFALATIGIIFAVYFLYIRDILLRKIQPHIYSWIVWGITMGTATAGSLLGGGGTGSWPLFFGTFFICVITLLCLRFGTKNITRSDTVALLAALLAIFVWWQLDNPLLVVLMATSIDAVGYFPTFRKTWEEPSSESAYFWLLSTIGTGINIGALAAYNYLTLPYLIMMGILNFVVFSIVVMRGKQVLRILKK
jgi:hypothetical protein